MNRIRGLSNIEGHLLPELTREQQTNFLRDPMRYFLDADEIQSDAIMRELEVRQNSVAAASVKAETAQEAVSQPVAKTPRKKKQKARIDGQREMLLPITGGGSQMAKVVEVSAAGRKAS